MDSNWHREIMVENRRKPKPCRRLRWDKEVKGTFELITALKAEKSKEDIKRIILRHPHLMAEFITQFMLSK